ncbi:MAG: Ig-like domain-containing protein, partial [Verrucomicrobiota bacterium]
MKSCFLFAAVSISILLGSLMAPAMGEELESLPPVVVKTVPSSGSAGVKAGEATIQITFSKEM